MIPWSLDFSPFSLSYIIVIKASQSYPDFADKTNQGCQLSLVSKTHRTLCAKVLNTLHALTSQVCVGLENELVFSWPDHSMEEEAL
jgi:hypothetical protein